MPSRKPNVLFVFADQMRAQATHYAGDPNARTDVLDRLVGESTHLTRAISGCPVCCPARASLITGQQPLTHCVFVNDVTLRHDAVSLAQAFAGGGYDTAYIGKWHLHGRGRGAYIPREERHGFDFWRVRECTHDYWDAHYFADSPARLVWKGYDAIAQTQQACEYLNARQPGDKPFLLMLSWGPPHDPYLTAPPEFRRLFDPARLVLPPNIPAETIPQARESLAGYYAHIAALDHCLGSLLRQLDESRLREDTILVFWSDHGDMVGSQGQWNKQRPWDESIRVPLIIRWPAGLGSAGRELDAPIETTDLMPTLLGLAGLPIPATVEGSDYAPYIRTGATPPADDAVIACYWPFAQYHRGIGGREFRGLRTRRHTFVRELAGAWMLFDNQADPYQLDNLVNRPETAALQAQLDARLQQRLQARGDRFEPGMEYIRRHGYPLDEYGAVPYTN